MAASIALFCAGFPMSASRAAPVIILDPYFYRTAVSEPVLNSKRTILGYYDEDAQSHLAPLTASVLQETSLPELRKLALEHARQILLKTDPRVLRDKNGVVIAVLVQSKEPALSSIALLPGLPVQFENVLGKDCYLAVPNRGTVYLFPRVGNNILQFANSLTSFYHNSAWPVSTELFEWRGGRLQAVRDLDASQ